MFLKLQNTLQTVHLLLQINIPVKSESVAEGDCSALEDSEAEGVEQITSVTDCLSFFPILVAAGIILALAVAVAPEVTTPVVWTLREEVDKEGLLAPPAAELVMGHFMPPPTAVLLLVVADGTRQGVATEVVV